MKSTYTGSGNRRTGNFISYGERVDSETQYQIFVSKSQFELATHVLAKMYSNNWSLSNILAVSNERGGNEYRKGVTNCINAIHIIYHGI